MPTVHFYLYSCAIIAITCSALSLQGSVFQRGQEMIQAAKQSSASPHGNNGSYKNNLTSSGAFPRYETSSISSYISPIARTARNSTFHNDTLVIQASSSNACCFVVQDKINVRFWADYLTHTTVSPSYVVSHITFATQYIDTLVTTNVSTAMGIVNKSTNIVVDYGLPTIPNSFIGKPGPLLTAISLSGSLTTAFGATITSPTQFYVFTGVNVVYVPAISDTDGRPACATTSTYRALCSTYAQPQRALYITGINSNVESYFNSSEDQRSAALDNPDVVPISFSEPFVYVPLSDPFPSRVVNENFGYVPQTLIEWMAQDSGYASRVPGIVSCLPGGHSIDLFYQFCGITSSLYVTRGFGPAFGQPELPQSHLTLSTTVTVAGKGCFHPGGCPSPAMPGASAVTATATVTPEAERLPKAGASSPAQAGETSSPGGSNALLPSQAPNRPLPAPAQIAGSTPVISPDYQATNPSPSPLLDFPSKSAPTTLNQPPSEAATGSLGDALENSPENVPGTIIPPHNPVKPHSNPQGLGAIIAGAFGITPASPPGSENIKPSPGPTPIADYSISIAPSASAVVVNGITSILPATGPGNPLDEGNIPIAVGSQQISQNAASQYVVAGQTITPGAPPINIQGTEVSVAPSGSAIVIAGSTIALSPTNAPGFRVGAEIVTADSASRYVAGGQTLVPGGPAVTVSGTRLSLAPSATQVIVGSSTIGLGPTFTPPPLTVGSQIFTANSASEYIIDGQTLIPGAPAITISNTPLSLAPDASEAVIGGITEPLRSPPTLPPIVIASHTFTANNAGAYVIGSQTVTPGSSGIVVPGSLLLAPAPSLSVFTVAGQVFTANPTAFSIDGTTVSAGGSGVTVSGTPISLGASGVLDVGNSTFTLSAVTSTNGPGLVAFTGKGNHGAVISICSLLASALTVAVLTGL